MTAFNQTSNNGVVGLRVAGNGRTGQLSVPAFIAAEIPWGTKFRAELTEEGILFRFVGAADEPDLAVKPQWLSDLA